MVFWINVWLLGCSSSSKSTEQDSASSTDTSDTSDTSDTDTNDTGVDLNCDDLLWTYDNVGDPFMTTWCTACHSVNLGEEYRAGAPLGVNFDTQADVQAWIPNILNRIYNDVTPMPPSGDPPIDDIERVAEWLRCGAL